jgi:hypothetical protein
LGFIKPHADTGHSRLRDDDFIGFFHDETPGVHPAGEERLKTAAIRTISILQAQSRALQPFSPLLVTDAGDMKTFFKVS